MLTACVAIGEEHTFSQRPAKADPVHRPAGADRPELVILPRQIVEDIVGRNGEGVLEQPDLSAPLHAPDQLDEILERAVSGIPFTGLQLLEAHVDHIKRQRWKFVVGNERQTFERRQLHLRFLRQIVSSRF